MKRIYCLIISLIICLNGYSQSSLKTFVGLKIDSIPPADLELDSTSVKTPLSKETPTLLYVDIPSFIPNSHSIDRSKDVGEIAFSSSLSPSGAYTIDVPIEIATEARDFQPKLSLAYNSSTANGVVGYGWNLSGLSVISRGYKSLYYEGKAEGPIASSKESAFSLDGQKLIRKTATSSQIEYTSVTGNIKVIGYIKNGNIGYFDVFYPDGKKAVYGFTTSTSGETINYPISKMTSRDGLVINYSYTLISNHYRLDKITYGQAQQASVVFSYTSSRSDAFNIFTGGIKMTYNYLLSSITTKLQSTVLRTYTINYTSKGSVSVVDNINCSAGGKSLNPLKMYYGTGQQSSTFKKTETQLMHWYNFTEASQIRVSKGKFDYGTEDDGIISVPNKAHYVEYYQHSTAFRHSKNRIENQYTGDETIIVATGLSGKYGMFNPELKTEAGFVDIFAVDLDQFEGEEIVKVNNTVSGSNDKVDFTVYTPNLYAGIAKKYTRTFNFNTILTYRDDKSITPKFYYTGDFNGDGKMEVLAISAYNTMGQNNASKIYLFDLEGNKILYQGTPFNYYQQFPKYPSGQISAEDAYKNSNKLFSIDYDGDGKTDLCLINDNGTYIYTFDVTGSSYSMRQVAVYTGLKNSSLSDREFLAGEFNGDGKTDFLLSPAVSSGSTWKIYTSTGNGQFEANDIAITSRLSTSDYVLQDINMDGQTDLVEVYGSGENKTLVTYFIADRLKKGQATNTIPKETVLVPTNMGSRNYYNQLISLKNGIATRIAYQTNESTNRLLSGIVNSLGTVTKIAYARLNDQNASVFTKGYGAQYPYTNFYGGYTVAARTETYNNGSLLEQNSYQYSNAVIHKQGLGFCGFEKITSYNSLKSETTTLTCDPYHFSVPTKEESFDKTNTYTHDIQIASDKTYKTLLKTSVSLDKATNVSTTTSYTYDSYGSPLTETRNYGNGITVAIKNTYNNINSAAAYIIGLPVEISETTTRNGSSVTVKETFAYNSNYLQTSKFTYYNNNKVSEENYIYDAHFNLTSSKTKPYSSTNWISENYMYDSYGRVTKKTATNGTYETYTYDANGMLGTTKDQKNNTISYLYDPWGDNIKVTQPDGSTETVSKAWVTSSSGALYSNTHTFSDAANTISYYNAKGQEVREGTQRYNGAYLYTDMVYDNKDRIQKKSMPFMGSSPSAWNTYGYDNYNRVTSINYASGKKDTYSYSGLTQTALIKGVSQTKTFDALGDIVSVSDPAGTITYSLRPDGKIASSTAPGNVTIVFTYDQWGRQTGIADPSAGTRNFTYDAAGNINKETDANGKVTLMTYDAVNRLVKKEIVNDFTSNYSYNSDGLLTLCNSTNGTKKEFTYDNLLRVSTETETAMDGKWFKKTYAYSNGNLSSTVYTSQSGSIATENYIYSNGNLSEIKLNNSTTIWKVTGENNMGMATTEVSGPLTRTYGYDAYGLPTSRSIKNGGTIIQNATYNFNASTGNLNWRKDNGRNLTENFSYDNLNRLTSFSGKTISYDVKGNITDYKTIGQFTYSSSKPYAIENVTPYGNEIPQRVQTITYNGQERPSVISENGYAANFYYNTDGNRVKMQVTKNNAAYQTEYYFSDQYEIDIKGSTIVERLYLGGNAYSAPAVYVKQNGAWNIYYLGRDYLGSITHIMNSSGNLTQELSYDAWGRLRNPVNQTLYAIGNEPALFLGRGYTGHEHLLMFGLVNMNARLYDPVIARFLSPDPYIQSPFDSQNFNRYSYCMNNPLVYMDPSGEFFLIDDLVLGIIGGVINLGVNIFTGNIHGNVWQMIGQGAAAFGSGFVAGAIAEYGPAAWAAGGALVGATNAWLGGATGTDILLSGVAGGVAGLAGGFGGQLGSKLGAVVINGFKITTPIIKSAITGTLGGMAGGYAGGFASTFAVTGDLGAAGKAGLKGLASGSVSGLVMGTGSYLKYAHDNNLNVWSGKPKMTNEELIQKAGEYAEKNITDKGHVGGSKKHAYASKFLKHYQKLYGDRGIDVNVYFKDATGVGILDVLDNTNGMIYDYKFGYPNKTATQLNNTRQMQRYRNHFHLPSKIIHIH